MSATLVDDSVLVRELGCDSASAAQPIRAKRDRGVGERMVLAPTLIDKSLDVNWVKGLCKNLARNHNVVVLTPSEKQARSWEECGATVALGDEVGPLVKELKDSASGQRFAALPQRYDGVDLPDDSCRILVIDGLPHGEGVADRFDSSLSQAVQMRLIHRIEQGMGRAVRSHADMVDDPAAARGADVPGGLPARPPRRAPSGSNSRASSSRFLSASIVPRCRLTIFLWRSPQSSIKAGLTPPPSRPARSRPWRRSPALRWRLGPVPRPPPEEA